MSKKYPWHGTEITKSDHFYFVWFNFTNQCYLYRTRTKIFFNHYNKACMPFKLPVQSVSEKLNQVDEGLGEYIRHRGQHVHEWAESHVSYRGFEAAEMMFSLFGEFSDDVSDRYKDAKWLMSYHITRGLDFMSGHFAGLEPTPSDAIIEIMGKFAKLIDACELEHAEWKAFKQK
jgi:hypothetical protein